MTTASWPVEPKLLSLLRVTEHRGIGPNIFVQTSAGIIAGSPVSSARFERRTREVLTKAVPWRQRREADTIAEDTVNYVSAHDDGTAALSLLDAVADLHVGYSLELPAVRIPIHQVVAWWLGGHKVLPQKPQSAGGVGVGVGFAF